jgi:ferredoxin
MSTTIYYFTGTGNSLQVARELARQLAAATIASIIGATRQEPVVVESETVGVVFPIYFLGMPEIVQRFVETANFEKTGYLFAVETRGGMSGRSIRDLQLILARKEKRLDAAFKVSMPANYVAMYDMYSDDRQQRVLAAASLKVKQIAAIVSERRPHVEGDPFIRWPLAALMHNRWLRRLPSLDERFTVTEKCNSCGVCAKVCPVDDIVMEEGRPRWQHHCQQCFGCIHWCPQRAIEAGKKTAARGRYHHPQITVLDVMAQKE